LTEEMGVATRNLQVQVDRAASEARGVVERLRAAEQSCEATASVAQRADQRASAAEASVSSLEGSLRRYTDDAVDDLRLLLTGAVEGREAMLSVGEAAKRKADEVRRDLDEFVRSTREQLQQTMESVDDAGRLGREARLAADQATEAARQVGLQAENLEARLVLSWRTLERRMEEKWEDVGEKATRAQRTADAVRTELEDLRTDLQARVQAVDVELRGQKTSMSEQLERVRTEVASVVASVSELGRKTTTAVAGATRAAADAGRAVESLRAEAVRLETVTSLIQECRERAEKADSQLREEARVAASEVEVVRRQLAQQLLRDDRGRYASLKAEVRGAIEQGVAATAAAEVARRAAEEGAAKRAADEVASAAARAAEAADAIRESVLDQVEECLQALQDRFERGSSELQEDTRKRLRDLEGQVGRSIQEGRAEQRAAQVAAEVGLSAQRLSDQLEWLQAIEAHTAELQQVAASLQRVDDAAQERATRIEEIEAGARYSAESFRSLADSFALLRQRASFREDETSSMRAKLQELSWDVKVASQGFATIQGAFSLFSGGAGGTGGTFVIDGSG